MLSSHLSCWPQPPAHTSNRRDDSSTANKVLSYMVFRHTALHGPYSLGGDGEMTALLKHPPSPSSQSNSPPHHHHRAPQAFLLTNDLWMCLAVCVLVCLPVIVYNMSPASIQSVSTSRYCCLSCSFEIFAIFNRISMFFNPFFLYNLIYWYLFEEISLLPSRDIVGSSVRFCYLHECVTVWMYDRVCSFSIC